MSKIYSLANVDIFIETIIDSFIKGYRVGNVGPQVARWIILGLQDLENDPIISSLLADPDKIMTPNFRDQCYRVITPEKIEQYQQFDNPANI